MTEKVQKFNFLSKIIKFIKRSPKKDVLKNCSIHRLYKYPSIKADCFIPLGEACRPAYWLRETGLRYCSLPFDWMMSYSLKTVSVILDKGMDSWFVRYKEDKKRKEDPWKRFVIDVKNKISSMHDFSKEQTVKEGMPKFKEKYKRRYERMKKILSTSKSVCFVCNRADNSEDFSSFLIKVKKMYPELSVSLVNIRHSDDEQKIIKYELGKKVYLYEITANDIHKGSDNFWIGNDDLWKGICAKFKLSSKKNNLS